MKFNILKKNKNQDIEHNYKDVNQKDNIQIVISRLENQTKVTVKQFFAEKREIDGISYWINEKNHFKQPVSDYYMSKMNYNDEDLSKIKTKIKKLEKLHKEITRQPIRERKYNIRDIEHELEVEHHNYFMAKNANNETSSVIGRNLENFRKVEYIEIGNKLYPIGFNSKLMTYFIIPIDKDITLDKHRENIMMKYMTGFQKSLQATSIVMIIIAVVVVLGGGFLGYKLFFAYDSTQIAEIERICSSSALVNMQIFEEASTDFTQSTKDFNELVQQIIENNKDLAEITPQTQGDLN